MVGEGALALMLAGTTPAAACRPKLDVTVIAEHLPPVIRSTYDLNEIRALADRSTRPPRHDPFGFYASTFGYQIGLDIGRQTKSECIVVTAKVRLMLGNRVIEVANDLEARSCRHEAIVAHYMRYARQDDAALTSYANRAYQTLKAKPTDDLLGDGQQGDMRGAVTAAIRRIMDEALASFDQDRWTALNAVDTEHEIQRLSAACASAL